MANRSSIRLNHNALAQILKHEVMGELYDLAGEIVGRTGMPDDEYEIEEWVGVNRARVSIKTVDWPAHAREARDHNLVRALGGVPMPENPDELIEYTSRAGVVSMRTRREVANYTRSSGA